MVFIPGASFTVTSPNVWDPARTPRTEQLQVASFCIDRTEMPRAKYPVERCGPRERNCDLNAAYQGPATCVSPKQAECACAHDTPGVTKRLPTDPEWILAALGTDGRRFPWGNDPYPEGYKVGENFCPPQGNVPSRAWLCPVEANTLDRSPFGVIGMSTNGSEMTATCEPASKRWPKACVVRAGDLDHGPLEVPGSIAYDQGIHSVNAGLSFRCAVSERASH
jgi:formylglycine-generating enzyme required for sulfatase activity